MILLAVLGAYGWSRRVLLADVAVACLGVLAALGQLRVRASGEMGFDDFTWSIVVIASLAIAGIHVSLFAERTAEFAATAARRLVSDRCGVIAASSVVCCWPTITLALGAPAQVVAPSVGGALGLLGLGAMAATIDQRWALAPFLVVVAASCVPGLVPAAIHPLAPSQHPDVVLWAQLAAWVIGSVAWAVAPVHGFAHRD